MSTKPWVRPQLISLTRMDPQESALLTCKYTQPQANCPHTYDNTCIQLASSIGCLSCSEPTVS